VSVYPDAQSAASRLTIDQERAAGVDSTGRRHFPPLQPLGVNASPRPSQPLVRNTREAVCLAKGIQQPQSRALGLHPEAPAAWDAFPGRLTNSDEWADKSSCNEDTQL